MFTTVSRAEVQTVMSKNTINVHHSAQVKTTAETPLYLPSGTSVVYKKLTKSPTYAITTVCKEKNRAPLISARLVEMLDTANTRLEKKRLILVGLGYRFMLRVPSVQEKEKYNVICELKVGYSHLLYFPVPNTITAKIFAKGTQLVVESANKQLLSLWCAQLQSARFPDPYKGKGIRFEDQIISLRQKDSKGT